MYTFSRSHARVYHVSVAAMPPQSVRMACTHNIHTTSPFTRLHVLYTRACIYLQRMYIYIHCTHIIRIARIGSNACPTNWSGLTRWRDARRLIESTPIPLVIYINRCARVYYTTCNFCVYPVMSAPLRPATTTLRHVVAYITSTDRATPCRFIRHLVIGIAVADSLVFVVQKCRKINRTPCIYAATVRFIDIYWMSFLGKSAFSQHSIIMTFT